MISSRLSRLTVRLHASPLISPKSLSPSFSVLASTKLRSLTNQLLPVLRTPSRQAAAKMDTSDPNIARAIRNISATKKSSPFPWTSDEPQPQPFYTYISSSSRHAWLPQTSYAPPDSPEKDFKRIAVYTWNIDFMLPHPTSRMSTAIAYLESLIFTSSSTSSSPPQTPTIILLQELLETDLVLLHSSPWVRAHFHLTDLDASTWESGYYGTASLIDKRLPISSVFRVHYSATKMERDGLFVDISLPHQKLRICNTHLESLAFSPPLRPAQLATAATYMQKTPSTSAVPTFSLLAGDLNAIQPFDRTLHIDNGLSDAYLSLGGSEDSNEGYTWGQTAQTAQRLRFGCSRMDKVLFCGEGASVGKLERFGLDAVVKDETITEALIMQGLEKAWVTDHLGLRCELKLEDDPSGNSAQVDASALTAPET